jgi:puromycin-sensitive aminopeptidase
MSRSVTRLFSQFVPEHYELAINLHSDKTTFSGTVVITGKKTGRPSQRITLHQKNLKVSGVTLNHIDKKGLGSQINVARTVLQNKRDEVRIHADTTLYPGHYTISINFSGKITDNMDGLYPCYFEETGVSKKLLATQFESHHAREVFPCIDEPEAKATFKLTLTHNKDELALSNTPVESESVSEEQKTTVFEVTPIMSTYLLAFVVGELSYLEATSKNGVKIRTYATSEQIEHSTFALETAVKCMDFYEAYYDIPFPLAKCDFVALPDFASGAMENWGLITFREQTLLCDENHTSLGTKQYVALVVAHELTHQWFGNLVTMRWWTDLWLNEGFASWMEYLAIDSLFPEWQLWSQFIVDEVQTALKMDSLEHTHPIEVSVKHPDEIRTIFDAISYQKGGSVIHMLQDYLGAEPFRDGLRHYLKKHSYKNTDTIDLWQALEDVTKKPVKEFMNVWTSSPGYPILSVDIDQDKLQITQSRFVSNPLSLARHDKTVWPVPLLADGLETATITKKINSIKITGVSAPLKLNNDQSGFYRVEYSDSIRTLQEVALDNKEFDPIDRMALLSDSFEVTKGGYQSVDAYLDLLSHYKLEDSLSVWEIIAGTVGTIRTVLSDFDNDDRLRNVINPFIIELVKTQLKRLTWEAKPGEPHLDTLLRPIIIGLAVGADEKSQVKIALDLYKNKMAGLASINPDLRDIVYAAAARNGDLKTFEELLNLYKKTSSSDEKLAITSALTCFKQPALHTKVLQIMTTSVVRKQDTSYWLAYSFMNRHSKLQTWKWMKDNWQWLKDNLGTDLSFSRMPIYAARVFFDQELIDEYKDFFVGKMEPMIERSYNQGLEMAQTSAAWRKRDSRVALDWFTKNTN